MRARFSPLLSAAMCIVACTNLPSPLRAPSASEMDARDALLTAWSEAGREVPRAWLTRPIDVYLAPQADVTAWCARPPEQPVMGCSWTTAPYLGAPMHTMIYLSESGGGSVHHSLVIHELAHQLRAAWVHDVAGTDAYLVRLRAGGSEQCVVHYPADPMHCDTEQRAIEQAAMRLWEQ
jgi:hypothetical protein